jgi:hypothetical protein
MVNDYERPLPIVSNQTSEALNSQHADISTLVKPASSQLAPLIKTNPPFTCVTTAINGVPSGSKIFERYGCFNCPTILHVIRVYQGAQQDFFVMDDSRRYPGSR